jgi:heat shock protein HtpX
MAKRSMAVNIINELNDVEEKWHVNTVAELAKKADVGMLEVGIFSSSQRIHL